MENRGIQMLKEKWISFVLLLVLLQVPLWARTPDESLRALKAGNQRFVEGKTKFLKKSSDIRRQLVEAQHPFCSLLACADSRVAPEIIFDQGIGDLFVVRLAGNVSSQTAIESLDFSVASLEVPLIVVMGHQNCGAVNAVFQHNKGEEELGSIARLILPSLKNIDNLYEAILANVRHQVALLKSHPLFRQKVQNGELNIVGAYYDFITGKALFLE